MKIIDCFTFYNEIELLIYRLNILNNVVDHFIIVESTHTHAGHTKPLYFKDNLHLFDKFKEKIIHIIVNDFKYIYPNINTTNGEQWINEHYQRNCISKGIDILQLNMEDLIMISDLDEIPDPTTLQLIKNNKIIINNIKGFRMDLYYYNLNNKLNVVWDKSKIFTFNYYIHLNNTTLTHVRLSYNDSIERGGWHLSYFGNSEFIKNKIINFGHQEYNNETYTNVNDIEYKINNNIDIYNRTNSTITYIPIINNNYLPPQYSNYLTNFYKL